MNPEFIDTIYLSVFVLHLNMKSQKMILGIDPGTNIMGYCLLNFDGQTYEILNIGSLRLTHCDTHLEKLHGIVSFISDLLSTHKPEVLAIEEPFFGKNVQSMLKLGRAQGAVIAIALQHNIEVVEITPRRVKQSVTGSGSASKEQVAAMVARITGQDFSNFNADATDAAAIAVSYTLQKSAVVKPSASKKKKDSDWSQFVKNNPEKLI